MKEEKLEVESHKTEEFATNVKPHRDDTKHNLILVVIKIDFLIQPIIMQQRTNREPREF